MLSLRKTANDKDGSIMQTTTKTIMIFAIGDSEGPVLKFMSAGEEILTARYNKFDHVIEMLKSLNQEPLPKSIDDLIKGYNIEGVTRRQFNAAMVNSKLMKVQQ